MSNDAPKMKKYIVEAPEPGPGEKLSSGGIRKNGKMVVTFKNARPYEEPTNVAIKQPKKYVPATPVQSGNSKLKDVGGIFLGILWNEVGRPFLEAYLHDLGQRAIDAVVSKPEPKQRPTVIDVEPEDVVVVPSEDDNIIQFQQRKR